MKYIIEAGYDFDGSDVAPEIIQETLQDSLNCHVTLTPYQEPDIPKALLYEPPDVLHRAFETPEIKADQQDQDTLLKLNMMLYVDGSKTAFRCGCGANVFSLYREPDGREYYECHGCWTVYRGEKA